MQETVGAHRTVPQLPELPDDVWLKIIFYAGYDDVWALKSSANAAHVQGYDVSADDEEYDEKGDPWFFVGPEEEFAAIFGRRPAF